MRKLLEIVIGFMVLILFVGCSGQSSGQSSAAAEGMPPYEPITLRLIHITDAHIYIPDNMPAWNDFVESGVWEGVDAVVNTGDFCNEFTDETLAEFERIPMIFNLGNHEFRYNVPEDIAHLRLFSVAVGDWTIISVDGYWPDDGFEVELWLDNAIQAARSYVVILVHRPLVPRDAQHADFATGFDFAIPHARLREVVGRYPSKVKAVLSGNTHQNYLAIEHGIPFIATTELSYGYRILTLTRTSVESEFVWSGKIDFEDSTAWRIFPHTLPAELLVLGTEPDRNFCLDSF